MTPRYESWYWTCSQISLFVLQCQFNVDYLFGNSIFASCQVPDKYDQYDNNTDITVTGIKDGSNTTPTSYHISTWFVQSYTTSYKRPQGTRWSQRRCASVLMVVKCNHHKASAIRHWGCLATFTPLMSTEAHVVSTPAHNPIECCSSSLQVVKTPWKTSCTIQVRTSQEVSAVHQKSPDWRSHFDDWWNVSPTRNASSRCRESIYGDH